MTVSNFPEIAYYDILRTLRNCAFDVISDLSNTQQNISGNKY